MPDPIHIGSLIEEQVRKQNMNVSSFAKKLNCDRTNVYDIFKRSTIDTELLYRISKMLKYNFFDLYSKRLGKDVEHSATEMLRILQQLKLDSYG